MEMTWLETFQLLGLDLLAGLLLALVVLDGVDHALHSAWQAARLGLRSTAHWPSAATHSATVSFE